MKRAVLLLALIVGTSASASVSQQYVARLADAIRMAESSVRYPYGIITKRRLSESEARRWCCNTIVRQHQLWERGGRRGDYLVWLGNVYCPVGASNDPHGLNANWYRNVKRLMQ